MGFTQMLKKGCAIGCSLAMALSLIPAVASAASTYEKLTFVVDGITYVTNGETTVGVGTPGVRGSGADLSVTGADLNIPATVCDPDNNKTYTVTAVNRYAFSGCTSLRSVAIPNTITILNEYSFESCGVMDDSGDTVTYSGLTTFKIPSDTQLKTIGQYCFYKDCALQSFVMPASLTALSSYAFCDCNSFKTLEFEEGTQLTQIGLHCFELSWQSGQVYPKDKDGNVGWTTSTSYSSLGDEWDTLDWETSIKASKDYGGLTSVKLPASILYVMDYAFFNQRNLAGLTFEGSSLNYISNYAFGLCASLTEVSLPDAGYAVDVKGNALGAETFVACINLEKVTFGKCDAYKGRWNTLRMFHGCKKLNTVVYTYEKFLPASKWSSSVKTYVPEVDGDGSAYYGYFSSNPTLYEKVFFCSSLENASRTNPDLGSAVIREGTQVSSINSALAATDEAGSVILEGSIPELPAGYDAWALVECIDTSVNLQSAAPLKTPSYAYPINSKNLDFGSVVLSQDSYWYDNATHQPSYKVLDAEGQQLEEGSDYAVSWERKDSDGNWAITTDFTTPGTLRLKAVDAGSGKCTGSTSNEFQIKRLAKDTVFKIDKITYKLTEVDADGLKAKAQVGNGTDYALDDNTVASITIPASFQPEGTALTVDVTSIGANALKDSAASQVTLPSSITEIGSYSLSGMVSLKSIEIPANVTAIKNNAFQGDTSLSFVSFLGSTIATIGSQAFSTCASLRSVALPAITGNLGGLAFEKCVMLDNVTFNGNVTGDPSLGQFSECNRLSTVTYKADAWNYSFPSDVTVITNESKPADSDDSGSDSSESNDNPSNNKPNTVTTAQAGSGKTRALYTVSNPVAKTATYTACKSAGSTAIIPASVKIGAVSYAVIKVEAKAFAKAPKVKTVIVKSKKITTFAKAFKGSKVKTVKVPKAKKKTYKKLLKKKKCGKTVKVK